MTPGTARGAALLVAAMAGFSLSDVLAKQLAGALPASALAWARYTLLLASVAPLALRAGTWRSGRPMLQALRAAALVGSALLFLQALHLLPVAEATAMVFASPLFVTALAVLALREPVRPARWLPVVLGFIGVLVVIRPGAGVFGWAAVFPVLSSMCWACAVVSTRTLGATDSAATTMLYSALLGCAALTLVQTSSSYAEMAAHAGTLAAMSFAWCAAQWLTIAAYRAASAAAIAPFAYTQLLWANLLGLLAFGHVPGAWSLAGMAVILASGLLAGWQQRLTPAVPPAPRR